MHLTGLYGLIVLIATAYCAKRSCENTTRIADPTDQRIQYNQNLRVNLPCLLINRRRKCRKLKVNWYFNGTLLTEKVGKIFPKRQSLIIAYIQPEDAGEYECRIGNQSKRFMLQVINPNTITYLAFKGMLPFNASKEQLESVYWLPEMNEIGSSKTMNNGDNVEHTCYYYINSNITDPKLTWYFIKEEEWRAAPNKGFFAHGDPIDLDNPKYELFEKKKPCLELSPYWRLLAGRCFQSTLLIRNVGNADRGKYTCELVNPARPTDDQIFRFIFEVYLNEARDYFNFNKWTEKYSEPLKVVHLSFNSNSTVCAGDNFTFKCQASPNNGASVRIALLNRTISDTGPDLAISKNITIHVRDPRRNNTIDSTYYVVDSKVIHTMTVTLHDTGFYACMVYPDHRGQITDKIMYLQVSDCADPRVLFLQRLVIPGIVSVSSILLVISLWVIGCCYRKVKRLRKQPFSKRVIVVHKNEMYDLIPGPKCMEKTPLLAPPAVHLRPENRGRLWMLQARRMAPRGMTNSESGTEYRFDLDPDWEIPLAVLNVGEKLGEGAFGVVYSGEAFNLKGRPGWTKIGIKMLKNGFSDEELVDIVKEMELMKRIEPHRNIIQLLGTITQDGPLRVVMEFAPHGNLREFLREHRPGRSQRREAHPYDSSNRKTDHLTVTTLNLTDFGAQIARGMTYLSSRGFVHRDLAARNILVGEGMVMKIADFGLTRIVQDYYKIGTEGRLPIKWMAPEAIADGKSTRKSDVWSFGILLWEIFSLGGSPYASVPMERVLPTLQAGVLNEKPPYANAQIYELMCKCWLFDYTFRPDFASLVTILEELCDTVPIVIGNSEAHGDYMEMQHPEQTPGDSYSGCFAPQHGLDDDEEDNVFASPSQSPAPLRHPHVTALQVRTSTNSSSPGFESTDGLSPLSNDAGYMSATTRGESMSSTLPLETSSGRGSVLKSEDSDPGGYLIPRHPGFVVLKGGSVVSNYATMV